MIQYNTWINGTKLPTKRTTALINVDTALSKFQGQPTQPNLNILKTAWTTWKSAKGNWKNSDRYKKATGNPNPLQQLDSDLATATVPSPAPTLPVGGRPLATGATGPRLPAPLPGMRPPPGPPPGNRPPPGPPGGRPPGLPVVPLTTGVGAQSLAVASKPKLQGGIAQNMGADGGPGKMTADGKDLVKGHTAALLELGAFACLDAKRFGGSPKA